MSATWTSALIIRILVMFLALGFLAGITVQLENEAHLLLVVTFAAIVALILVVVRRDQFLTELHAREVQLRMIGNNLPDGIVYQAILGPDGKPRLRYVSDGIFRLSGLTPAEAIADFDRVQRLIHPEDLPGYLAAQETATLNNSTFDHEFRQYTLSREIRWIHARATPGIGPDGKQLWNGLAIDVTKRHDAEDALRRNEERLRALFENSQAGILVYSVDGKIEAVNPRFASLLGYSEVELQNTSEEAITHAEDLHLSRLQHSEVIAGNRNKVVLRKRFVRKDGECVWVELFASPIRDTSGTLTRFVGLTIDITDRRRLEEQLRRAQNREAIGQMAGGVAHDFNNLLTAALGNMALIKLAHDDPHRPLLKAAELAATRAADLTRKLLGYARRNQMVVAALDPQEVLDEVAAMLRATLDPRVQLVVNVEPDCGAILADASLLLPAILNLCLNARDAMPDGGAMTLSAASAFMTPTKLDHNLERTSGTFVRISVQDTGHGIPDHVKPRLFEPFFTTKPVGQGTGLGLPMVQGIVKQHNGWIEFRSEAGVGTCFDVYLPMKERTSPAPAPLVHQALPASPVPIESGIVPTQSMTHGHSRRSVLLVDDEEMIRNLGRVILERAGYSVLTAEDGVAAVDVFTREHGRVDLVILDVMMPRMSGPAAYKELMRISPHARILFSTGYCVDDVSEIQGSIGLLSKPYRPQEMLAAVRDAFSKPMPIAN